MSKTTVPESEIPEVQAYLDAMAAISAFTTVHATTMQTLRTLVEDANSKRQAADKVVRARDVFCGPWKKHNVKIEYDAQALMDAIGREQFLKVGGHIETQKVYSVDKNTVEASIATGQIPKDVVGNFRKESVSYASPKDLVVP